MENVPESSSKGTKRRRAESSDAGNTSSSLENDLTFTDTLIALRIMRAQFPQILNVSVEPFILKSQLYSSVKDRTQVDRELESLRRDKVLRLFKLNTGQDDHAVMFLDDYLKQIDRVFKRMEGKTGAGFEVFEWFKTHVLDSKLETGIEHLELCSLLSLGGKVKDSHISLLINAGVLIRQLIDPNMYWIAIPNIGSLLKGLVQGRKEIISLLNRRQYKEMMLAVMEKKRLRMSPLDMRFHLRDLIGSGHLRSDQTPAGSSPTVIHSLIEKLPKKFALKKLGRPFYFLGIKVQTQSNGSLLLTQAKYIKDLLAKEKWKMLMGFLYPCLAHCSLLSLGGKVKDNHISLLINPGVLTRQLIDPNMYWIAIPNIGPLLKGLVQGRKEIISLLSRRQYKEMMLAVLEKKRLRMSPLDMRFHLRDLIGSGHLRSDQTPVGIVIRVSKD